jgi:hypothetical protein
VLYLWRCVSRRWSSTRLRDGCDGFGNDLVVSVYVDDSAAFVRDSRNPRIDVVPVNSQNQGVVHRLRRSGSARRRSIVAQVYVDRLDVRQFAATCYNFKT